MPYSRDGIFPTPAADLKFNFGERWRVSECPESPGTASCNENWCLGIWNQRHFVEWPENTDVRCWA